MDLSVNLLHILNVWSLTIVDILARILIVIKAKYKNYGTITT